MAHEEKKKEKQKKKEKEKKYPSVCVMLDARDLKSFGVTIGRNLDGTPGTSFYLDGNAHPFEELFLKKLIIGLGYKVTREEDLSCDGHDHYYWLVETTFPWADFQKL